MAKVPAFAKVFAGRWRIVEMDVWDKGFLDLVETAHLTFKGAADGEIAFGALKGFLDVRYGARDGPARSSRAKEMMRTIQPPVADGLSLAPQAASSDTSTSTTATIQASYAIVPDFFNSLLGSTQTRAAGYRMGRPTVLPRRHKPLGIGAASLTSKVQRSTAGEITMGLVSETASRTG